MNRIAENAPDASAAKILNISLKDEEVNIMPGFDRTGPMGAGAMTGGARGFCNPANAGYRAGNYGGFGCGRGGGFGRGYRAAMGGGFARGFCRGYGRGNLGYSPAYAAPVAIDPSSELHILKIQAETFRNSLDSIQQRIADLEKSTQ
jgi:hypothetical protein